MRKVQLEIESIKLKVSALKDKRVRMLVNRGRKKIVKITGRVTEIYPSVFVVKTEGLKSADLLSFSYSDVLTKDVRLTEIPEEIIVSAE